jgi:hypothetical protein
MENDILKPPTFPPQVVDGCGIMTFLSPEARLNMKKIFALILSLCLLAVCLTGCGETAGVTAAPVPEEQRTAIDVWYVDDGSTLWDNFRSLISSYNMGDGAVSGVTVSAEPYSSDSKLLEALKDAGSGVPDIAMCSAEAALAMEASGVKVHTDTYFSADGLSSIQSGYLSAGVLSGRLLCVPAAVTPYVLMVNDALASKVSGYSAAMLSTAEGVCSAAQKYNDAAGDHFFTADSFAELFRTGLAQYGDKFNAQRDLDIKNDHYVYLYNLIAEAAYNGGVTASDTDAAKLVAKGSMACAAVTSAEVVGSRAASGVSVLPFPVVQGGTKLYPAKMCEMVITGSDESGQKASAVFMNWLMGKGSELTALSGWYQPSAALSSLTADGKSGIAAVTDAAVGAMAGQYAVTLETPAASNLDNNLQFESSFRETLAGLD